MHLLTQFGMKFKSSATVMYQILMGHVTLPCYAVRLQSIILVTSWPWHYTDRMLPRGRRRQIAGKLLVLLKLMNTFQVSFT